MKKFRLLRRDRQKFTGDEVSEAMVQGGFADGHLLGAVTMAAGMAWNWISRRDRRTVRPRDTADRTRVGDSVAIELVNLVRTMDTMPGTERPQFSLTYRGGVVAGTEAWSCAVEGDLKGDDGNVFTVRGYSAADALSRARKETLRRVP